MKKNKILGFGIVLSYIFQGIYFKYFSSYVVWFSGMCGINTDLESSLRYTDALVFWFPLFLQTILFMDKFDFWLRRYGQLLLIRMHSRQKVVLQVIVRMALEILSYNFVRFLFNCVLYYSYITTYSSTILHGFLLQCLSNVIIILLLNLISIIVNENIALIVINIYLVVSAIGAIMNWSPICEVVWYPWGSSVQNMSIFLLVMRIGMVVILGIITKSILKKIDIM